MSEKGLQDLADARFAKIFGRLQKQIGDAIDAFYREVAPGHEAWMDDTRALAVLEVAGGDAPLTMLRSQIPATWWQHFKAERFPPWLQRRFPVRYTAQACAHLPWLPCQQSRLGAFKAHVRNRIEEEIMTRQQEEC